MRIDLTSLSDAAPLITAWRASLLASEPRQILRSSIVFAPCYVLPQHAAHYQLRQAIADHFEVHPVNVVVAGSAKLGFSIAPQKRYNPFGDKSDLDVAVVDDALFARIWWEIHENTRQKFDWPQRGDFSKYLMRGWIRPDKFPAIQAPTTSGWWDFFKSLSKKVGISVNGAAYKDWRFFESYHITAIEAAQEIERSPP